MGKLIILFFTFLCAIQLHANTESTANIKAFENLKFTYRKLVTNDNVELYYLGEMLHKTNSDASGTLVQWGYGLDAEDRKSVYKKIIYKLVQDSTAKESYGLSLEILEELQTIEHILLDGGKDTSEMFLAWFYPYVYRAKEEQWINGYGDGSFKPEKSLSRAEASKIIYILKYGNGTDGCPK